MSQANSKPGGSDAILAIAVEGLAVGILTLIAGATDDMGNVVITFMAGMWVIFLVMNAGTVANIAKTTGNVQKLAA